MKKIRWFVFISILTLVLAACGSNENNSGEEDVPEILEVELITPEVADVGETVLLQSIVTQGEEKVTDADEVEFEVWEEGKKEEGEMLEAKNNQDGTYEVDKAFDHDAIYHVQVHVTARGMHVMPKKTITVGDAITEQEDHGHEEHDHGDHDHHGHAADGFSMHFMNPENVEKGKETELIVHLQDDEGPMEKARVRFEIWNDDVSDKRDWIDAAETKSGEYGAAFSFEQAGTYSIQIHVQNDDGLHEHEEHQIEVKE
ncbi:FixH family protein [Bacillus sp. FJAT-50079]|uniref:FixH family protein n=1 Tax=Bacillus sp. FJAT-50079 TaxID=2833577 RepID=UPI001BC9928F|nr:FixH family protein [Bacillus sp. FJAT-50079]MBS4209296.1 FixH family protein [Bacillus sp. FJAT-50079]